MAKQDALFEKLGLHSPQDLVLHLPLRYENHTVLTEPSHLKVGHHAHVVGRVRYSTVQFRPKKQLLAEVELSPNLILQVRLIHFYPNQQKQLSAGCWVRLYGELRPAFSNPANLLEMIHPAIVPLANPDNVVNGLPKTLTPIYPTTAGLSQARLRKAIMGALETIEWEDTLPLEIQQSIKLLPFRSALETLHLPPANSDIHELNGRYHPAWQRIKFDEVLAQQLLLKEARVRRSRLKAPFCALNPNLVAQLRHVLPFRLTLAQNRVCHEIANDLASPIPMTRLLQGDVGCGKTVVAAFAAAQVIAAGYQSALMAPTELLAEQHWHKFKAWFEPLGVRVAWLSGAQTKTEKLRIYQDLIDGTIQLVVGTHALIQEEVHFANLGLVIIDEQHRFGVVQRIHLQQARQHIEQDSTVHQLMMSATPIPRTLTMSYFADLDISKIDELPPGRQTIKTKLIEQSRRHEVLENVRQLTAVGRQVYWVCPLIEESETLSLKTVFDTYHQLTEALPKIQVGLLHGRMKAEDKTAVMAAFTRGDLQLLVTTTVIEVGVDVPNASLMVIEHAERFGLAQLHQLRGRVGRGREASVCVLLYATPLNQIAKERLRCLYQTQDGFLIAQKDLELRGPGEILGIRQAGLPILRYIDLSQDTDLVELARTVTTTIYKHYPEFIQRHLDRWLLNKDILFRA